MMNSLRRKGTIGWSTSLGQLPAGFVVSLVVLSLNTGCFNPYTKYYQDRSNPSIQLNRGGDLKNPVAVLGRDPTEDYLDMLEEGFTFLGFSSFNGPKADSSMALQHARGIGAQKVVLYGVFRETVQGAVSFPSPALAPSSTTSYSGTITTETGTTIVSGTASTQPHFSTQLISVPYSVNRYEQTATFWAKARDPVFGIFYRDLSREERASLGRNGGVVVIAVIKRSPAFFANVLRGDVITVMDSVEIIDTEHMNGLDLAGKRIDVQLLRGHEQHILQIQMNERRR
jgi:serine protease Do